MKIKSIAVWAGIWVVAYVLLGKMNVPDDPAGSHDPNPDPAPPYVPDPPGNPDRWIDPGNLGDTIVPGLVPLPPDRYITPMPILDGWEPVDPALIAMAQYDLGQRLGLGTPVGDLVSAQPMTWSTTALGCPITGRVYTQMTVQGAKVMLSYQGRYYTYHASAQGTPKVVLCDRLAQSQGVTQ